jgi:hypothetical protein
VQVGAGHLNCVYIAYTAYNEIMRLETLISQQKKNDSILLVG